MLRLKARRVVVTLIFAAIAVGSIVAAEYQWHIISNILGPYRIRVLPETGQFLVISVTDPPSDVLIGQTISLVLTVENIAADDVQGYVLINVTSTSYFPPDAVRLELRADTPFGGYTGVTWFSATGIDQGYAYKSQSLFTWRKDVKESAKLYITFNQAGEYQIMIAITSN